MLGLPTDSRSALDAIAVGRLSTSKASVLRAFRYFNRGKIYADQIKPANFLITAHVAPLGHPMGADPAHFRLVRPFELRPHMRTDRWANIYDGNRYMAAALMAEQSARVAVLCTYRDVVSRYRRHPESKSGDAAGNPSNEETIGLLTRLHILAVGQPRYIGKESNSLEEVESGIVGDADSVYVTYTDHESELQTLRAVLQTLPRVAVARRAGISTRRLQDVIIRAIVPHAKTRLALVRAACAEMTCRLGGAGDALPIEAPFEILAALWLQSDGRSVRSSASRISSDARTPNAAEIAAMAESDGELAPRSTMPT